jgi:glycosyltransferase involved in cell wall biosynthesis
MPYVHVGAWATELEFQRYRPRRVLDEILREFDLLQFVTGAAPWGELARHSQKPTCLWVATTIRGDRATRAKSGSLARQILSRVMMRIAEKYERHALESADVILALSPYSARSLSAILPERRKKIGLAFCGIDTQRFRPSGSISASSDNRYILCVARLFDARKNVIMLLRAYASLLRERRDIPLLRLVGEPLSSQAIQLLDSLGIAGKVILTGPTHGEELAEIYRNALFFVLPSDEEGLGIVILEAMSSGLAVISTACGGPEVAVSEGVTGLLTPVGDQNALERAMRRLLNDEELRSAFGVAGRQKAEKVFSLDATSNVFLRQYDALLGGASTAVDSLS